MKGGRLRAGHHGGWWVNIPAAGPPGCNELCAVLPPGPRHAPRSWAAPTAEAPAPRHHPPEPNPLRCGEGTGGAFPGDVHPPATTGPIIKRGPPPWQATSAAAEREGKIPQGTKGKHKKTKNEKTSEKHIKTHKTPKSSGELGETVKKNEQKRRRFLPYSRRRDGELCLCQSEGERKKKKGSPDHPNEIKRPFNLRRPRPPLYQRSVSTKSVEVGRRYGGGGCCWRRRRLRLFLHCAGGQMRGVKSSMGPSTRQGAARPTSSWGAQGDPHGAYPGPPQTRRHGHRRGRSPRLCPRPRGPQRPPMRGTTDQRSPTRSPKGGGVGVPLCRAPSRGGSAVAACDLLPEAIRAGGRPVASEPPECTPTCCRAVAGHGSRLPQTTVPWGALEGQRPPKGSQKRFGRRLKEVAEVVRGGCCRLPMP